MAVAGSTVGSGAEPASIYMKSTILAAIAAALVIIVSGCTTTKSGGVTYDSDSQTTIVTGKATTIAPLAGPVRTLFLKAEISPGETGLYLVVLYLSANGWLSADHVVDTDGRKIEGFRGSDESFKVGYSQVTKEIYYIPLTRRYLEMHSKSGLSFRLEGPTGGLAASQPPSFVGGFLTDLDSTQKKLAGGEVVVKNLIAGRSTAVQGD
jgi:hypothetical protein